MTRAGDHINELLLLLEIMRSISWRSGACHPHIFGKQLQRAELVGEFDLADRCTAPVRRKSRPLRTLLSQRASLFVVQYRGDIQI